MQIEIRNTIGRLIVEYGCPNNSITNTVDFAYRSHISLHNADLENADLSNANLANVCFMRANLKNAVLYGANLRSANLQEAILTNTNFAGADLSDAQLQGANLDGARFDYANLSGVYIGGGNRPIDPCLFRIPVDPDLPRKVAEAVFSGDNSLEMNHWHTCDTVHCLAGWAIHLSGPAGYALEKATSPSIAGAMLMPSASHLFYTTDKKAMLWLKNQLPDVK